MIIDAHVHIFSEVGGLGAEQVGSMLPVYDDGGRLVGIRQDREGELNPSAEKVRHTPEMLIAEMDLVGVDKAVLLQGPFYGEINRYISEAVAEYPDRLIGAAYLDPWAPDPRGRFESIADASSFRSVKLEFSVPTGLRALHPGARLDDAQIVWLWDELSRLGMVLTLDLGAVGSHSYQTDAVRRIAEEHPDLNIVICHLAQPTPAVEADPGLWMQWEEQIGLGCLANVYFDTASLPAYVRDEGYPYPTAGRYLRMAVDRIGPEKIMWGTDLPMLLSLASYSQLAEMAVTHIQFLSSGEKEMILSGNALRVYG